MVSKAGYYFYPNIKLTSNDYNLHVLMLWLHAEHKIGIPQPLKKQGARQSNHI